MRTVRCCATQSSQRNMSSPSSCFLSTGSSANKWNRGISRRSKKKIHGHNNAVPATFDELTVSERKRDLGFGAGARGRDLDLAAGDREHLRGLNLAAGEQERERERDFLLAGAAAQDRLRWRGERLRRCGERLRRRRPWDRERLRRRPPPPRPRPSSSRTRMIALSKGLRNSESSSVRMALRMSSEEPYSTTPEPCVRIADIATAAHVILQVLPRSRARKPSHDDTEVCSDEHAEAPVRNGAWHQHNTATDSHASQPRSTLHKPHTTSHG